MHLEFVEPSRRYADLLVPGGGHNRAAVDVLVARLRILLEERSTTKVPSRDDRPLPP